MQFITLTTEQQKLPSDTVFRNNANVRILVFDGSVPQEDSVWLYLEPYSAIKTTENTYAKTLFGKSVLIKDSVTVESHLLNGTVSSGGSGNSGGAELDNGDINQIINDVWDSPNNNQNDNPSDNPDVDNVIDDVWGN